MLNKLLITTSLILGCVACDPMVETVPPDVNAEPEMHENATVVVIEDTSGVYHKKITVHETDYCASLLYECAYTITDPTSKQMCRDVVAENDAEQCKETLDAMCE